VVVGFYLHGRPMDLWVALEVRTSLLSYQFFKKALLVDAVVLTQKKKVGKYFELDIIAGRM